DEYHGRHRVGRLGLDPLDGRREHLQRDRADVRAVREAEEDEAETVRERRLRERPAVDVRELEVRQRTRRGIDGRVLGFDRSGGVGGVSGRALRPRDREHQRDEHDERDDEHSQHRSDHARIISHGYHARPMHSARPMTREALKAAPERAGDYEGWVTVLAEYFEAAGLFYGHGTDNAGDEAFWLIRHLQGWREGAFEGRPDVSLAGPAAEIAERRATLRKPLAYLLGEAWFAGLPFHV